MRMQPSRAPRVLSECAQHVALELVDERFARQQQASTLDEARAHSSGAPTRPARLPLRGAFPRPRIVELRGAGLQDFFVLVRRSVRRRAGVYPVSYPRAGV